MAFGLDEVAICHWHSRRNPVSTSLRGKCIWNFRAGLGSGDGDSVDGAWFVVSHEEIAKWH